RREFIRTGASTRSTIPPRRGLCASPASTSNVSRGTNSISRPAWRRAWKRAPRADAAACLMGNTTMRTVSPPHVKAMLAAGGELALLDAREELIFSRGHLLHARSLPLSRIELRIDRLVPRRATRVVLIDDGDGLAQRAAGVLARLGYTDVAVLNDG